MTEDRTYMARALQLAAQGRGYASPNPMVGAVIVARGRIIGEGWHRCWGKGHAEVNAFNSVAEQDAQLLPEATIYVTLEPCSHYGKTPPCAKLLIDKGIKRAVIGMVDPFSKVAGRGIQMLREAGIEVVTGLMERECRALNRRFITAHTLRRPWILLKWAQSADGFMAEEDGSPVRLSNPLSMTAMHRERAAVDAIMVGTDTANNDNPQLDVRLWPARVNPIPVTFNRHGRLRQDLKIASRPEAIIIDTVEPLSTTLSRLYEQGITSVMVEGGPTLLKSFLDEGLADEIRIEFSAKKLGNGLKAPELPQRFEHWEKSEVFYGDNRVVTLSPPNGDAKDTASGEAASAATCCK